MDGNTVNFGNVKQDKSYPYTVTYTPDTKTFVWTINENVSNFAPVQLTYTVKLTSPRTAAGTYGVKDLNGDGIVDGTESTKVVDGDALYTNKEAKLVPVNSAEEPGQPLLFPKPSVSYTIKGSSGGHSGGTVTIPDDVPTGLNGKDHYAYVSPEEYHPRRGGDDLLPSAEGRDPRGQHDQEQQLQRHEGRRMVYLRGVYPEQDGYY